MVNKKNMQVCEICKTIGKDMDYAQFLREVTLGHATAITFEVAIDKFGLSCEMIAIVSEYYKTDSSNQEKEFAKKLCGSS